MDDARFLILVVEGELAGRGLELAPGRSWTVGRVESADLFLDHPSVSRQHATFQVVGQSIRIVDLGSANGLKVRGKRVGEATLGPGQRFRLGGVWLEIRTAGEPDDMTDVLSDETLARMIGARACPDAGPPTGGPRLGPYRLLKQIGSGGMGWVYQAVREGSDEVVAVKMLREERLDEKYLRRFLQEIEVNRRLDNPCIVGYIDSGWQGPIPYIVSEYVEGGPLRGLIRETGPLPIGDVDRWARQIGAALVHAHGLRILHRDLKPSNVVIERLSRAAKILDFGIARCLDDTGTRLTATGHALGSLRYMPPEQLEHTKSVDERADIYGLSGILYEALTGGPAYPQKGQLSVVKAILETDPVSVRVRRPEVPESMAAAIDRGLARDPADRFGDVASFLAALRR